PIERRERVRIEHASGRVAAADVASTIDVPPFARSAMDGYAVVAAETTAATKSTPVRMRMIHRAFTGEVSSAIVTPAACVEIATGAPLPGGADAVVMVEDTSKNGDDVEVFASVTPGQNVGRRGADITTGDRVISAGQMLTPSRVGALAATGATEVDVFARPRVAILSTGNEVVQPGRALAPGQIYDVNRYTLDAVVAAHGGRPE